MVIFGKIKSVVRVRLKIEAHFDHFKEVPRKQVQMTLIFLNVVIPAFNAVSSFIDAAGQPQRAVSRYVNTCLNCHSC